jgi:ATP-dependent Clp protease ATP-binding subunit ClpC
VVFHAINKDHIKQIVDLMLREVWKELADKAIKMEVTDAAKELLGEKGFDPVFGARPLRRVIQDLVEDPLSEALLRGDFGTGDTVLVDCEDEKIVLRTLETVTQPSQ